MKFYPVYYFTLACPTIEATLKKIDEYVEKEDVIGIQIDMPSKDPYGETDMVKSMMAKCLKDYNENYDLYMDSILSVRSKHKNLQIHIVVYPDVVAEIGINKFVDFCKDVNAYTVRIAGTEVFPAYVDALKEAGLPVSDTINYFMPEEDIERCKNTTGIIHMRSKRKTEAPNRGLETWKDRIAYVRKKGVTARIFATADMKTADDLIAAKNGGADGVYVGNVLMNLWNDEKKLWPLLHEMQMTIEK